MEEGKVQNCNYYQVRKRIHVETSEWNNNNSVLLLTKACNLLIIYEPVIFKRGIFLNFFAPAIPYIFPM